MTVGIGLSYVLDMGELGLVGAQKLAPGRGVVEEVAHLYRGAGRMGGRRGLGGPIAAVAAKERPLSGVKESATEPSAPAPSPSSSDRAPTTAGPPPVGPPPENVTDGQAVGTEGGRSKKGSGPKAAPPS